MATLSDKEVVLLEKNLQRIFAMNIMRSTFREVQNTILATSDGDKEKANDLFEALLVGEIKEGVVNNKGKEVLKSVIDRFSIPVRLSKEVYERGDFINIITSDLLSQTNRVVFLNRIRRVDGEEFQFITDADSTIHLLQHFLGRVQDLDRSDTSKKIIADYKKDLTALKTKIEQLIG